MLAPVERRDGHVRRPVLRAHGTGGELGDVGHELRLQHAEIHGVQAASLADRVGDVVVAVDERDRRQDAQGTGSVVLRGQAVRWTGGQYERQPDRDLPDHAHVMLVGLGRAKADVPPPPYQSPPIPPARGTLDLQSPSIAAPVTPERPAGNDHLRVRRGFERAWASRSARYYVSGPMPDAKQKIALELNGEAVEVAFAPHKTLLEVLREDLGLTGTKHGCELGECGTCTVLVDATPVLSCLVLGLACAGHRVKTVEGMAERGTLHPLQEAFAELGAAQCGYCTPAFLLAAEALLASSPRPTRDEIKQALSGNLCRCTGYIKIYEAVELAAARMRGEDAKPAPETLYGVR